MHNKGFSLVEVMIASTIIALMVLSLLALQGTLLGVMTRSIDAIERTIGLNNFLYIMTREETPQENVPIKKVIDERTFVYMLTKVHEKSILKNLHDLELVELAEQDAAGAKRASMMSLLFVPPASRKKP